MGFFFGEEFDDPSITWTPSVIQLNSLILKNGQALKDKERIEELFNGTSRTEVLYLTLKQGSSIFTL